MNTSNQDSDLARQEKPDRNLNRDIHQRLQSERFPEASMAKESRSYANPANKNRHSPEGAADVPDDEVTAESADH